MVAVAMGYVLAEGLPAWPPWALWMGGFLICVLIPCTWWAISRRERTIVDPTGLTIEEAADAWVTEFYSGNNRDPHLPKRLSAQFQAWLDADPRHKAALIESRQCWDALASIPEVDLQEALKDGTPER